VYWPVWLLHGERGSYPILSEIGHLLYLVLIDMSQWLGGHLGNKGINQI
jgi:hypothetical protein